MVPFDDCVEVIKRVIQRNVWNEVLNVCADEHPTRNAFYTKAASELGLELPHFIDGNEGDYKIVSNDKLKRILGYKFLHPLV